LTRLSRRSEISEASAMAEGKKRDTTNQARRKGNVLMSSVFNLTFRVMVVLVTMLLLSPEATAAELEGLIEPYMVANIGSGVRGIIETVDVDRGEFVKKGQVVATLQSGIERATRKLAQARAENETSIKSKEAQLALVTRKEEQIEQLFREKVVPFGQMDEAKTSEILAELELQAASENKRIAELELQQATEVLKRLTIRSPINGVVVERFLSPGEFVEDKPILKIAQINPLNVEAIVPVELFGSIKVGMKAKVKPENPIGGDYMAEVKIVDNVIDAASGTFGVRLELPNKDYRLPAGIKCKIIFSD